MKGASVVKASYKVRHSSLINCFALYIWGWRWGWLLYKGRTLLKICSPRKNKQSKALLYRAI